MTASAMVLLAGLALASCSTTVNVTPPASTSAPTGTADPKLTIPTDPPPPTTSPEGTYAPVTLPPN